MSSSGVVNSICASVVVPARNEAAYIRACVESLLNQSVPEEQYEIIVVNGNSTDSTSSILRTIQLTRRNLRVVENPMGFTPVGMNLGIRAAQGAVIIIAGAHSTYPQHFVQKSIEYLEKTGADVVGGPIEPLPSANSLSARLNSVILSSRFGVGNSGFRVASQGGFVDTVPFGAYKREVLERVGLYNERLRRNQDNDLSARVRTCGGRIYLTPELTVQYHPTGSVWRLFRKAFNDSKWHFFSVRENPRSMSARHFAPLVMLLFFFCLSIVSLLVPRALYGLGLVFALYFLVGFSFAMTRARQLGFAGTLLFPFACFGFHLAYGTGTLMGFLRFPDRESKDGAEAPPSSDLSSRCNR